MTVTADAQRQRRRRRRPVPTSMARLPVPRIRARPTVSNGTRAPLATARTRSPHAPATLPATRRSPAPVTVNVANTSFFQNEVLATGFNLPTSIEFLPDGRMLVVELAGTISVLPPPYTPARPDAVPAAHERRLGGRAAGHLRRRARPEFRDQPLLLRLLHARDAEPRSAVALHRQRDATPARSPAASSSCTRIPRTPMPSTTAAPSTSATTASSTSRPASTSTPATRSC